MHDVVTTLVVLCMMLSLHLLFLHALLSGQSALVVHDVVDVFVVQMALRFFTEHVAWTSHSPSHGSLHLLFLHALLEGHSELVVHSCLHSTYGSPLRPDRQTHAAAWFFSLHSALIPQ